MENTTIKFYTEQQYIKMQNTCSRDIKYLTNQQNIIYPHVVALTGK